MTQRPRIYYTETDKSLMWDRWQKGESLNSIARLFGRGYSSIRRIQYVLGLSVEFVNLPIQPYQRRSG